MVWIGLMWLRIGKECRAFVNTVMNLRIPYNVGNFLSSCATDRVLRRADLSEAS
jgi:hypothetical protein